MIAASSCRACRRRLQICSRWARAPNAPVAVSTQHREFSGSVPTELRDTLPIESRLHDRSETQYALHNLAPTASRRPQQLVTPSNRSPGSQILDAVLGNTVRNSEGNKKREKRQKRATKLERVSNGTAGDSVENASSRIKGQQHRPTARSKFRRNSRELAKEHKETGRKLQWGYLRANIPESEIAAARKTFGRWKQRLGQVHKHTKPQELWVEEGRWLLGKRSVSATREAWHELSESQRRESWPDIMMSTLYLRPSSALRILEATLEPTPPGYAIQDVLYYVAQHMMQLARSKSKTLYIKGGQTLRVLTYLLKELPPGHMPLVQSTFGILARALPIHQARALYDLLTQSRAMLHPNTSLQFARKLAGGAAEVEHKALAFGILKGLVSDGLDLRTPGAASVITSLLHSTSSNNTSPNSFSPSEALQFLMEKGYLPNVITLTAYLDTLCQRGEIDEAIRIARLFSDNGLRLDSRAFATLFRGAKHSHNADNVRAVLDLVMKSDVPLEEILSNALHCVFYFSELEPRQETDLPGSDLKPFAPMLRIYAERFDLGPLQSLIPDSLPFIFARDSMPPLADGAVASDTTRAFETNILPVVRDFVAKSPDRLLTPPISTLATMFRAYIKSLQKPYDLMALYAYFKTSLQQSQGPKNIAAQLVREHGSLIHDTFMLAMVMQPGLTRPALEVFGDMLKDNMKSSAPGTEGPRNKTAIHPEPTVFSFTVLLNGLLLRQETSLAEQIRQVMRENRVVSNLVTWNVLIKGYASMQNLPKTVGALQDLEASGFKPDEHTFKAFGRLKEQSRALKMMERIIDLNKEKVDREENSGDHRDGF